MFFPAFPSFKFSATKSAARTFTQERSQPKAAHATLTATTPSKKPSRLQTVLRALRLSPKVEENHHQTQANHTLLVASHDQVGHDQRPCPTTYQGTGLSRPSATATPSSFPNSIFSTADLGQLTLPRSTATTPATIYSNSLAPSTPNSPLLANDIAPVTNRMDDLDFAVALTEEREAEKAARKLAEDRLAEEIASHARTEELLLNERERHRKAESARTKACYALEKANADLEADLLDLTARSDLLHVQALQEALVQLHIVDANDRQYRLKYPACADCMGPFLKAVCTAAKQATETNSKGGPEHELATAAIETFQAPSDEDSCSESVSDKHARAPAPTEWFKSGSTRTRRVAPLPLPSDENSCSESVSDRHARAPAPTEWFKSGSTRTCRPA